MPDRLWPSRVRRAEPDSPPRTSNARSMACTCRTMVTRPHGLTGTSRTTPIGSLQRVTAVRRPRVMSGRQASRPLCRSTSRQANEKTSPEASSRDSVTVRTAVRLLSALTARPRNGVLSRDTAFWAYASASSRRSACLFLNRHHSTSWPTLRGPLRRPSWFGWRIRHRGGPIPKGVLQCSFATIPTDAARCA